MSAVPTDSDQLVEFRLVDEVAGVVLGVPEEIALEAVPGSTGCSSRNRRMCSVPSNEVAGNCRRRATKSSIETSVATLMPHPQKKEFSAKDAADCNGRQNRDPSLLTPARSG